MLTYADVKLDILVPVCICEPPGVFSPAVRQRLQLCCSVMQLLQLCCSVLHLCCSVLSGSCCSSVAACCSSVAACCSCCSSVAVSCSCCSSVAASGSCCTSVAASCTSVAACCHAAVAPLLQHVLGFALSCRTNSCCLCETVSLSLRLFTSAHGFFFSGADERFPASRDSLRNQYRANTAVFSC